MTRKLLALLGGIVVSLAVVEAGVRVLVPDPYLAFENRIEMFVEDPDIGYRNRPHFHGYAQGTIEVRTNNLGFRGGEVASEKRPDTVRLLILGDSVTWGVGVQEVDAYPQVMERIATTAGTESVRYEVVNAGVIGYSLRQDLRLLERFGVTLSPDVVVVGLAMNDTYPTEDPFFSVHRLQEPVRKDVRRREYVPMPPPASYTYRWIRSMGRRWLQRWRQGPARDRSAPIGSAIAESFDMRAWPSIQQDLRTLNTLARTRQFHLLVVVFPLLSQLGAQISSPEPQRQLREFFEAEDVAYLDLFDDLRSARERAFLDNMHFTVEGHRLVARRIVAELGKRQWLGSVTTSR